MDVKILGVVGAGQMGAGIAQVAAQAGLDVICTDVAQASLDKGRASIAKSLERLVKKEKLTQAEADAALARVTFSADIKAHEKSHFVVEAVTESEDLKRRIFTDLDGLCPKETILASNTS